MAFFTLSFLFEKLRHWENVSLDVLLVHRSREKKRFPQAGGLMSGRAKRGVRVQGTLTPKPGLILLPWLVTIHQQHPEHPVSPCR